MSHPHTASIELVDVIRTNPSGLPSFLSERYHSPPHDYETVLAAVIDSLSSLSCTAMWQLHSHHIVRLEALLQACAPPHSPAFNAVAQLILNEKREEAVSTVTDAKLNAAFTQSALSSLLIALLRLSARRASAFPLYPLAAPTASALVSHLIFSSHPHSQVVRQHVLVMMLLVHPPSVRQQLMSALLLQCLSSSSADSSAPSLSSADQSSVLRFLCQRVPHSTLLSSYSAALTSTAASSALSPAVSAVSCHRLFLSELLTSSVVQSTVAVAVGCCSVDQPLFDLFASTVSSAVSQRHSLLLTLSLQLARHCIALLNDRARTAQVTAAAAVESGGWRPPRDYSAWFDEQFSWVLAKEGGGRDRAGNEAATARNKRRREKFVLRKKDDTTVQRELDGEADEEDEQMDESEDEDQQMRGQQSAAVRQQQRAQAENKRKERQHEQEANAQNELRRKQRQLEARMDRQERVRFVLLCMLDSLQTDEPSVVTHYMHVVDRYWRGEGLLSEAEVKSYCNKADIRRRGGNAADRSAIVLDGA